jgi:hypothetical protein
MSVSPYPQSNLLFANFSAHCKDMRVEWAKTRARAERWSEEIILLNEEMRRVLQYLNWKATWWLQQQGHRADASPDIRNGIDAYAAKQADLVLRLARSFAAEWYPMLVKHDMPIVWPPHERVFVRCSTRSALTKLQAQTAF